MPRRKRITGKELIRALAKVGFAVVRVQGSHHRLRHADGRVTTVPVHAGETIGPGHSKPCYKCGGYTASAMVVSLMRGGPCCCLRWAALRILRVRPTVC
jgi:predicted RNA binding protein YcfA (HicA-like mRNA interferase family)